MALSTTQAFNVTKFVVVPATGTSPPVTTGPDPTANAAALVATITKTVFPDSWLAMGGHGTIQAYFQPTTKQWFVVVFNDQQTDDVFQSITKLINDLS